MTVRLFGEKADGSGVIEMIRASASENDTREISQPGLQVPVEYDLGLNCTQVEPQDSNCGQIASFLYSTGTPARRVKPVLVITGVSATMTEPATHPVGTPRTNLVIFYYICNVLKITRQ